MWLKIGENDTVLIHYIGNEEGFKPGPHGNCKDKDCNVSFQPTLPSILNQLKQKVNSASAHIVYKEKNHKSRNLKQCQNLKYVK